MRRDPNSKSGLSPLVVRSQVTSQSHNWGNVLSLILCNSGLCSNRGLVHLPGHVWLVPAQLSPLPPQLSQVTLSLCLPVSDVTSLVTCARASPAAGPAPPHPSWLTSPARAPASATRTPRSVLEAVSARPVTPGRPGPRMSSSTWGHKRRGLCGLDTSAYCHLCTQSSGVFYRDSFIIIFFSKVICLNITISWSSLKIYQEYHDWLNRIFVKR